MAGFGLRVNDGQLGSFSSGVKLDPVALAELLRGPEGPVFRHLSEVADRVRDEAKNLVGVRTGNLRDHIIKRVIQTEGSFSIEVGADVEYAMYHHEGSEAVEGKLMVFETADGATVFTMRRAAIPGNPFLTGALRNIAGGGGVG